MNYEALAWLLLSACNPNEHQLLMLLQDFRGRYPTTEQEYRTLTQSLRRMGHILEKSPTTSHNNCEGATAEGTNPQLTLLQEDGENRNPHNKQHNGTHQGILVGANPNGPLTRGNNPLTQNGVDNQLTHNGKRHFPWMTPTWNLTVLLTPKL